jgi:hypothetical protein
MRVARQLQKSPDLLRPRLSSVDAGPSARTQHDFVITRHRRIFREQLGEVEQVGNVMQGFMQENAAV